MFDTAQISSGFTLSEPTLYANHINKLIALGLDVEVDTWEDSLSVKKETTTCASEADVEADTEASENVSESLEELD